MDFYSDTNSNLKLKKKIMRRIYMIWLSKKLITPFAMEVVLGIILMILLASNFSFFNVWHNAPILAKPISLIYFFALAFINTELLVKLLLISSIIILYSLSQKMIKSVAYLLTKKDINFFFQTRKIKDI
mgnify:FL=1